jgi:Bacterial extracellular solute-binding proteins, family 3.
MEVIIGIIGVIIALAIGIPTLKLQRRQTQLAESSASVPVKPHVDILDRLRVTKTVRIAYVHYPPFAIAPSNGDDEPSGLYVELIRFVCQAEGLQARFTQVRFSSAVQCIVDDQADIVLCIFQTIRRSHIVDFCAFMHTISVSGVARTNEDRVTSQADLLVHPFKFVVCRDEIGHELLSDQFRVPPSHLTIIDTSNVADIIAMVAMNKADLAIADSLSCQHGLAARGAEGPKLKPVLRQRPLYLCLNGVMIAKNQPSLASWLDSTLKAALRKEKFGTAEVAILKEYGEIIGKL